MKIIVACNLNYAIGLNNDLLYHITEDMRYFKELTIGKGNNAVIMGRKTYESLPNGKLVDRVNYVITRNKDLNTDDVILSDSLDKLLEDGIEDMYDDVWIIGGESIYDLALKTEKVTDIYMTKVLDLKDGDKLFPIDEMRKRNYDLVGSSYKFDLQSNLPIKFLHFIKPE